MGSDMIRSIIHNKAIKVPTVIRELQKQDIPGLNTLPPTDWGFNYETFTEDFFSEDFYFAFVIILDDKVIGTGNLFLKGKIGWLANIIVHKEHRGKGLGSKMTRFLVDFSKEKGCDTQLLIATQLGGPVYQKLGFRKVTDYQCFDSETGYNFDYPKRIRDLKQSDLNSLYELDKYANGEDRAHLIGKFYETGLGYFDDENKLLGVYLPDFGRGLVLARNKKVGTELLKLKHSQQGRRTQLPVENQAGIDFLEKVGLKKGPKTSRMMLGKDSDWKPECIYSYGSGYCG
ncbi:MAG: GNAT superfamily N-acetyltransferase [Neolewinella sp.]|jgi:GNAT superfamily N-acetyltransferase